MKILVIEDDIFFQKFYATKLQEAGYEVDVATNGEEGLEKARNNKPKLILLDLIMPKKDGFEVLKALAQDEELKTIPILVFSNLGQEKEIEEAKNLGAGGYITKSISDFDGSLAKIASLMKQ